MSEPRTVRLDQLPDLKGAELGPTPWRDITQDAVNAFADVTGDHQWIHVDVDKAAAGPFGGTIAHGYFTLSLAPVFFWDLLRIEGAALTVNYGLNKVRFPAPVPVGTAVRASMTMDELTEVSGGLQAVFTMTVERDGGTKPVCVAEIVFRMYR